MSLSDDELDKVNGDLCDQVHQLERERHELVNGLRSRVAQLEREASCYQDEIAGLKRSAAERSDLASEVTSLRAQLGTALVRSDRWRGLFRRQLAIASDLAEGSA